MKKIINGKKYDTDTARKLASYGNGLLPNDFRCIEESLYQKKTGEYFLYGEGGPMTKYAVSCGNNSTTGSSMITPISEAEARAWVEEHANDLYEEIFGAVEE